MFPCRPIPPQLQINLLIPPIFSVENRPSNTDPFTIRDGRFVGHDGFVVPKDFEEFPPPTISLNIDRKLSSCSPFATISRPQNEATASSQTHDSISDFPLLRSCAAVRAIHLPRSLQRPQVAPHRSFPRRPRGRRSGVPGDPNTFYFGAVDGGIWKTTNAGVTWTPDLRPSTRRFDRRSRHRSLRSESHLRGHRRIRHSLRPGLRRRTVPLHRRRRDLENMSACATPARSAASSSTRRMPTYRVCRRAFGHAYGPNNERGVYKSTDGGEHWTRVLDQGPDIGIADLAIATENPDLLFATTWTRIVRRGSPTLPSTAPAAASSLTGWRSNLDSHQPGTDCPTATGDAPP